MARLAGWSPDDFWRATPADVAAVLRGWADEDSAAPLERCAMAAMMELFPDGGRY